MAAVWTLTPATIVSATSLFPATISVDLSAVANVVVGEEVWIAMQMSYRDQTQWRVHHITDSTAMNWIRPVDSALVATWGFALWRDQSSAPSGKVYYKPTAAIELVPQINLLCGSLHNFTWPGQQTTWPIDYKIIGGSGVPVAPVLP